MTLVSDQDTPLSKVLFTLLTLLAFCLPISIAASSLLLFPLEGFYFLAGYWLFRPWPPRATRIEKTFIAFLLISVLSGWLGADFKRSASQLGEDLYFLVLVMVAALLYQRSHEKERLIKALVWGGIVTAVWGILQYVIGINQDEGTGRILHNVPPGIAHWPKSLLKHLSMNDGRITGLRSHPLTFAESLLFPLAYLLSLLAIPNYKSWGKWLVSFGVLMVALLLSQSRGPWLAFAAMMIAAACLAPHKVLLKRLGLLLMFPVILLISVPALQHRLRSIGDTQFLSNSERLEMWQAGLRMFRDHPLLGIGSHTMKVVSPHYQTEAQFRAYGAWGHLHNTYVNGLAERGILGFGCYLLLLGLIAMTLIQAYRTTQNPIQQTILMTALLSGVGWLGSGMTETVYNNSSIQMMFYFILGLGIAAAREVLTAKPGVNATGDTSPA